MNKPGLKCKLCSAECKPEERARFRRRHTDSWATHVRPQGGRQSGNTPLLQPMEKFIDANIWSSIKKDLRLS